ncbi:MAG: hypothetical protein RIB80_03590 [Rhodospirillales bacterium]|tara:strand:+ start:12076 stop:12477 length:402 start_codon:yes stop_codon:yes gene_type:complete
MVFPKRTLAVTQDNSKALTLSVAIFLAILLIASAIAGTASAAITAAETGQQVAKKFGVEVLRITPMTQRGRDAFVVKVMTPGGDTNSAFQINTLVIDANTGERIIQYGHEGGQQQWAAPPISHRTHPRLVGAP